MEIFAITLTFFLVVFAAMAVGVILQNKPILGSCGGIGALFGNKCSNCEGCEKKADNQA
ncbi:MAG: (Na+)-NQR maturation NqrM [Bacteriovoracaceae bacterium]|jgi:uncharacterized protein|nr:(Na+)-NQR maturation NqrM [Bacteriovoracaceae bacterium]